MNAARLLRKCCSRYFGGKRIRRRSAFVLAASIAAAVLFPSGAAAQVVISEFLYDAEGSDTDKEYVELFNAGTAPVDLTKWKISDGSNHTLNVPPKNGGTGSITLAPGAYALLVDSAADFIPLHGGIGAAVIDTVLSLSNVSGAITLIDESGATADSISYDKDVGGAGDGKSLTRTSISGTSFTAAAPTPGKGSFSGNSSDTTSNNNDSGSGTTIESSKSVSSIPVTAAPRIGTDAGGDRVVTVGVDVEFKARAYNQKKESVPYLRFHWNFGDGTTADGPSPLHRFEYPGRYVVIVDIPEDKDAAADEIIVTVEPLKLVLSQMPDGGVGIENRAGRTLDLSLWILRSSGRQFSIPDNTFILANSTLRIPQRTLGFQSGSETELAYPDGTLALQMPQTDVATTSASSAAPISVDVPDSSEKAVQQIPAEATISQADVPPEESMAEQPRDTLSPAAGETNSPQVAAGGNLANFFSPWWLGALGVAGLAAGSLVLARRFGKKEWDIEEMSETR